jgi:NAD(P)H-dependent flavin oxidoreductase YrpB (nitropropane dioxygenase family)
MYELHETYTDFVHPS